MTQTITLSDVRKASKQYGFKVKTESVSWGKACTYIDKETGFDVMSLLTVLSLKQIDGVLSPDDMNTVERINKMKQWVSDNKEALKTLRQSEGLTGLTGL